MLSFSNARQASEKFFSDFVSERINSSSKKSRHPFTTSKSTSEKDFSISEFSAILVIFETFHNFRINGDRRTD